MSRAATNHKFLLESSDFLDFEQNLCFMVSLSKFLPKNNIQNS